MPTILNPTSSFPILYLQAPARAEYKREEACLWQPT
nr:MAG TPA: hypothetical protein [Caudoviricetes sp.]